MLLLRLNGGGRSLFVHVVPMWSGEGSPLVNCPSTPSDWLIDFPDTQQQQQNETSPNITIPTNTQITNGHSIRWVKLTSIIWERNQSTIIHAHQLFYQSSSSRLIWRKTYIEILGSYFFYLLFLQNRNPFTVKRFMDLLVENIKATFKCQYFISIQITVPFRPMILKYT